MTDKKAYWVLPPAVKNVPYARIRDIDFFRTTATHGPPEQIVQVPPASKFRDFRCAANNCSYKPAVLSMIAPYSHGFFPTSLDPDLTPLMNELNDRELSIADFGTILAASSKKAAPFNTITEQQQKSAEWETRGQGPVKTLVQDEDWPYHSIQVEDGLPD